MGQLCSTVQLLVLVLGAQCRGHSPALEQGLAPSWFTEYAGESVSLDFVFLHADMLPVPSVVKQSVRWGNTHTHNLPEAQAGHTRDQTCRVTPLHYRCSHFFPAKQELYMLVLKKVDCITALYATPFQALTFHLITYF